MSDRELNEALRDLPEAEPVDARSVVGGFNPQPDPPKLASPQEQAQLIGLLLPAVQKVRSV